MAGPPVAVEMDCPRIIIALRGMKQYKIFDSLSNRKNMVFNMKTLDLTLWQRGEKKQSTRNERQILQIYAADCQFSPADGSTLMFTKRF